MVKKQSIGYESYLKDKLLDISLEINSSHTLGFSQKFLREYYYKFYAQTLVYNYYVCNGKNFFEYVDSLTQSSLTDFKPPSSFISGVLSQVIDDSQHLNLHDEIIPLGDIHYKGGTKYLDGNHILFNKYPNYDTLIREILSVIDIIPSQCFPSQTENAGVLRREFIEVRNTADNEAQVKDYFYNLGLLIPFLLLLRAIDVYAENILVSLPYPILFDLECILTGVHTKDSNYNLFHTGVIKVQDNNDVSALTGGLTQIYSYLHPSLHDENGSPKIKWKIKTNLDSNNLINLKGSLTDSSKYIGNILKGYEVSSKKILSRISTIRDAISEVPTYVRYIHRPTYVYSSRIQHYLFPNIYETQDVSKFMEDGLRAHDPMFDVLDNESMIRYECKGLSKGLIPVFYNEIHSHDILNAQGDVISHNITKPIDVWISHINNLGDFFDKQAKTLKSIV